MGRVFRVVLGGERVYCCSGCKTHVTEHDDLVSKSFQGRHGRAFLFNNVVNVTLGPREERMLITGLHTVVDIFCTCCSANLGWKYEHAFEETQKYKEGKFIVETARVLKQGW